MKKYLFLGIVTLAVLLARCGIPESGPGPGDGPGTTGVLLSFNNDYQKSILPPISTEIDHYIVSGSGPNSSTIGPLTMDGSGTIEDLLPGAWTFTVVGRNDEGIDLGSGTGGCTVVIGQIVPLNITVVEYDGLGDLLINAAWEPDIVLAPVWTGSLKDFDAAVTPMVFTVNGPACTAQSLTEDLAAGWFTMIMQLYDAPAGLDGSEALTTGRATAVRILKDYQTEASLWFHATQGSGDIDIDIDLDMHDELALTGSPAFSDIDSLGLPPYDEATWVQVYPGETKTFSVSCSETITRVFYLQGEQVQLDGTYSLDADALLDDEHFVLDVVAFSVDGRRAGSESWIVKKCPVVPELLIAEGTYEFTNKQDRAWRVEILNEALAVVATRSGFLPASGQVSYQFTDLAPGQYYLKAYYDNVSPWFVINDDDLRRYWSSTGEKLTPTETITIPRAAGAQHNFLYWD